MFANSVRNNVLDPEELENREAVQKILKILKAVMIISAIVSPIFFLAYPSFFSGINLAFSLYFAFEVYHVMVNCEKILNNALVEIWTTRNRAAMIEHLTRKAPVLNCLATLISKTIGNDEQGSKIGFGLTTVFNPT